ncbi:hypothetical protein JOC54_003855 [Alkalihalobacillus xiaoxiensis]|uniref:Uncharacterized protein n=1 Tax=Shouchella xiaoxiensis TaxID=766895 RepID=A0ABS2SYF3_9BACI|nr:hypothetical protein [Shouchella xiaoxiensis]
MKKWLLAVVLLGLIAVSPSANTALADVEIETYVLPHGGH